MKPGARTRLTDQIDFRAEHRQYFFHDRQTQARSSVISIGAFRCLREYFEDMILLIRLNADSAVFYREMNGHRSLVLSNQLGGYMNETLLSEFNGVVKQVHQNLIQPRWVAHHVLVFDIPGYRQAEIQKFFLSF